LLLAEKQLDALLLRRVSSFAWATCGAASHVNTASSEGIASLLITPHKRYLLTNNIEILRLQKEEKLEEQGWEFKVSPWHAEKDRLSKLIEGIKVGADSAFPGVIDLSANLAWLRTQLMPAEVQRFRILSRLCAEGMQEAIEAVRPGISEFQIASLLSRAVESRGVQAVVNLVGTDERIFAFRHPLPTSKTLNRYAMLILCGRKWGLVCSLTRLIHFGPLPDEIHRKAQAVAQVDAAMIAVTRSGNTLGDVFQRAQAAYAQVGFPDEWQLHHQGGLAGYEPREITATPASNQPVSFNQVYAWNPSITGTKSEDTILVDEKKNEILTEISDWPAYDIQINGIRIKRPAILERLEYY